MQVSFAEFDATLRSWKQAASARFARTTARERLLLGALVLGSLIYAPLASLEFRSDKEDAYVDAVSERASSRLARDAARRIAAVAADEGAVRDMQGWGFSAANAEVAQVLIERRLLEAATQAKLTRLKITSDPELSDEGPTTWLGVEVEADLLWSGLFRFMDNLAAWPEGFRVTSFGYEVRPIPPGMEGSGLQISPGTLHIGLAFPVEVADRSEGNANGTPSARRPASPSLAGTGMFAPSAPVSTSAPTTTAVPTTPADTAPRVIPR